MTNDAIYGCDTCRTTMGRSGCPTHRDRPLVGANTFITTCPHGVDLRVTPRCYLCRPEGRVVDITSSQTVEALARALARRSHVDAWVLIPRQMQDLWRRDAASILAAWREEQG